MKGLVQFALKRSAPEEGSSWSNTPDACWEAATGMEPVFQPDRRKSQRVFDQNLNRAYNALRVIQARAKHKPNPGLDARATKQAAKELIR